MILSPSIVLPVRENEVLGCLGVFYHSKWNKRDCKTSRTIRRGEYPAGTVKKDKPNFRRCRKNCKFERGILYYKKCSGKKTATSSDQFPGASEWRVCVRSEEEKKTILGVIHS